jgi:hypothetical protein
MFSELLKKNYKHTNDRIRYQVYVLEVIVIDTKTGISISHISKLGNFVKIKILMDKFSKRRHLKSL